MERVRYISGEIFPGILAGLIRSVSYEHVCIYHNRVLLIRILTYTYNCGWAWSKINCPDRFNRQPGNIVRIRSSILRVVGLEAIIDVRSLTVGGRLFSGVVSAVKSRDKR